ncbi:MAG: hypothetical protein KDJ74_18340 [Notoacmeibacter sp.]|nr:hypothetical protein [Notoacmeibacter sp.]
MEWRGIAILIKWCPSWLGATARHQIAHMEVYAANKAPLPITETGYRSNFINKDIVKAAGGPVSYAKAWLDEEARSAGWKAKEQESRQLSLF